MVAALILLFAPMTPSVRFTGAPQLLWKGDATFQSHSATITLSGRSVNVQSQTLIRSGAASRGASWFRAASWATRTPPCRAFRSPCA